MRQSTTMQIIKVIGLAVLILIAIMGVALYLIWSR